MLIVQGKAKKSPLCTITLYFQCIFFNTNDTKIDPQKSIRKKIRTTKYE